MVKELLYVGSIRTCLLQEGMLFGDKKDLPLRRRSLYGSIRTCLLQEDTLYAFNKTRSLKENALYGVNKDLSLTRRHVIWGLNGLYRWK